MSSVVDPSADTASLTRQERRSRTAEALTAAGDAGDPRERLDLLEYAVRINMGVARTIAGRYHHRGIEEDDLVQVAYAALTRAAHAYDPDLGHDFLSYAVPTIRREIKKHVRDRGWPVRPRCPGC